MIHHDMYEKARALQNHTHVTHREKLTLTVPQISKKKKDVRYMYYEDSDCRNNFRRTFEGLSTWQSIISLISSGSIHLTTVSSCHPDGAECRFANRSESIMRICRQDQEWRAREQSVSLSQDQWLVALSPVRLGKSALPARRTLTTCLLLLETLAC